MIGFAAAALANTWLVAKVLDGRRGKHLSAFQVMLNPYFLDRQSLTDDGRKHHTWLVRMWFGSLACWGVMVVSSFF